MAAFAAFLLRIVVLGLTAVLLSGATLTLAAERVDSSAPTLEPIEAAPKTLVVPDVTGQAYVFAKGILQDNGFAWHVAGPVQGFAANTVVTQKPVAGTTVIDTGAPTIELTLVRNTTYLERGTPDNDAPYNGTAIRLPSAAPAAKPLPQLEPVVPLAPNPLTTPSTPSTPVTPPTPTPSTPASAVTTPAATTPATVPSTPTPTPTPTPATPTPTPATPTPTPATPTPTPSSGTARPPDFIAPGAPKEPAKSQPLPLRAQALAAWLEKHRQPTSTNLNYWLYEHAYIVAGARFGWWHGAEGLQILVAVDKRAETLWGVGNQSELIARKALAEVQARAR
jgi:PASTA domain